MVRTITMLGLLLLAGCSGGQAGDNCDPFPASAAEKLRGCDDGLVCVGTKKKGRCVSMQAGP